MFFFHISHCVSLQSSRSSGSTGQALVAALAAGAVPKLRELKVYRWAVATEYRWSTLGYVGSKLFSLNFL